MNGDVIGFIAILLALLGIGLFKNRKVQSQESYLFAKRECGLWPLTCTLVMTELNTSTLLAFSGMGYLVGKRALYLPVIFLVGLLFYALTVAKKWKELDASSVASLFRKRYGPFLGLVASLSLLVAMLGFTATYVKSMTFIFTPIFPLLSPWLLSASLILLILIMTLRGGLVAIIRTDIYSFLLISLILPLIFYFSWKNTSYVPVERVDILPSKFIISLIILTMFTYILAPWYGQKIFSAKSKRVAFLAVIFAAILVFVFYGLGVIATSWLRLEIPSPELALPVIINAYLPQGIRGMAYATLFMISATTLAGVWSAMSAMVLADFWKTGQDYKRGLILTLCFACASYLLGNTLVDRILDKLILANIPVAALSFALLAGFYWKKASPLGALLSILTGLGWGIFCYGYYGEEGLYTWYWALYGIPLIFLMGIIGSLYSNNFKSWFWASAKAFGIHRS
jgi:SSS family solute:Na+ symporter